MQQRFLEKSTCRPGPPAFRSILVSKKFPLRRMDALIRYSGRLVQIKLGIASKFLKCNRNDRFPCVLQPWQAPWDADPKMDYGFERHSCKQNCGLYEGRGKCLFEAFEANHISELLLLQSSEDGRRTSSADTVGIPRYCGACVERPLRARVLHNLFCAGTSSVARISGSRLLYTVLDSARRGSVARLNITIPSVFMV